MLLELRPHLRPRRGSEPHPRKPHTEEGASPFVQERLDAGSTEDRDGICDLRGRVARARQRCPELGVGALAAGRRLQSHHVLRGDVKRVLQPAQGSLGAGLVEPIGLGGNDVEPCEGTQQTRPELAEPFGIVLVRAGPSRHDPIVVVSVGPPMEAQSLALVVDDDAALRTLVRVNLELEGFAVREAGSVGDAEAAVERERPDVVLLDVHLGGEESTLLLARLRAQGIPVALVTGSVDVNDYRDAADAILAKPFVPQHLVDVARRLARVGS